MRSVAIQLFQKIQSNPIQSKQTLLSQKAYSEQSHKNEQSSSDSQTSLPP